MPGTTATYGLPYQELTDAPDGPALGQNLAEAVEAELERIDAAVAPLLNTWAAYTPTWVSLTGTNPTLGSHTRTGRWRKIDDSLGLAQVRVVFGSSGYGTGLWAFGLPVPATSDAVTLTAGSGIAYNTTVASYALVSSLYDTSQMVLNYADGNVTPTTPFTFGNADQLWMQILFEIA
jgi:hypothetical protein